MAALDAAGTGGPTDIEVDGANGALFAPPAAFRAVVAGDGPPAPEHPLLAAGAAAIRAPAGRVAIETGGAVVEAWTGERAAALSAVGSDGRVRLVPRPAGALERAVLVLAGLATDEGPAPGPAVTLAASALAAAAAGDAAAAPLPGIRDYRRIGADGDAAAVELVRADDGLRLVVARGAEVELRPASAAELREAVAALVAAAQRS